MNNNKKNENYIIAIISLACIGLTLESMLLKWEFWVPPLLIIGTGLLWMMNLSERIDYGIRKALCFIFAMIMVLFHGVHNTSFFDVALVVVLAMIAFSVFNNTYMMNSLIVEYVVIMVIQFMLAFKMQSTDFTPLNKSRIILHIIIVFMVYISCVKAIFDRLQMEEDCLLKDERLETGDADMEDFLSNISHELRTPVNVVNGMSDLLIKRNIGSEAYSIKDAGIRLAYHIEDIQDYTECKRNKLMLEDKDYMTTSLINDVVTSFRLMDNKELELVVDLAPTVPIKMKGDIKKLHKIFRHLLENSVKFTKRGGIYIKVYSEPMVYGVNLCIEMTDTGIGMNHKDIEMVSEGMYQVNKKRNRSFGGIGLGLFIVYGFTHRMGGFVKIESEKNVGTTVRVTVPQKVSDKTPCLMLSQNCRSDILFHVRSDKYKVPRVRDFYRQMATNLANGIHVSLYSAETIRDIESLEEKMNVKYIFMGQEEYEENSEYFDRLSEGDIVVAVSASSNFTPNPDSNVIIMPKPLYGYSVIRVLNESKSIRNLELSDNTVKHAFRGIRALVVDDEPMNLVVATSLFADYEMITDTAGSGKEAINKFLKEEYDVVFMDHMMPEMDGVETMKHIKQAARELNREIIVIALTANVISGAREMFIKEGFDGFIAKPINTTDFERVLQSVLPESKDKGGALS